MSYNYNDKVGFINSASKQLGDRLSEQNKKMHELLKEDKNERSSSSHFDEGNKKGSSYNFEKFSSSESRPAPYSYSGKPADYFRGPTIRDVPPSNGSIGGTVTTWEWGTVSN
ncbi:hypothetical protein niasHT_017853 [Heterodera trifolii]|uniref:Uncharacterized protein n=1 Tax=Heterodera trifolii TaxID=157864 RepID=A0ABD2LKU4_9BILA